MVKLQEKEGVEPEYIWLRSAMSGEYSGVLVQLHRWLNNEGTELRSAPIFASPRQRARNLDGTDPLGHLLQSLRAELQGFDNPLRRQGSAGPQPRQPGGRGHLT